MQVAKYQNTITLFLAQCPVKSSPSATLVHAQSWRAGLYRAYIPPPRRSNVTSSSQLSRKAQWQGRGHLRIPLFEPERTTAGAPRCHLSSASCWSLKLELPAKAGGSPGGNQSATWCNTWELSSPRPGHFIRPLNLDFCFRCALIKRLRIDQPHAPRKLV